MSSGKGMKRRTFCLRLAEGTIFGAAAWTSGGLLLPVRPRAAQSAELAAVEGEAIAATRRAVELLGGMGRFVGRGQKIVVKPNIGWDRKPEQAANTNPEVVAEVVRMCLEAGAGEVRVFDRSANDPRLCYRRSGIEGAVEELDDKRAKVFIPDRRKYRMVDIEGGEAIGEWAYYEDALKADVFINVPVAKHHSLSGLTLGMKNIMGVIGGNRSTIHTNFDDKVVDLNLARPSDLTIVDASRILTAHGPQGGRLDDVTEKRTVVASADIVAADAYATRFFDLKPQEIDHIRRAHERGVGTMDFDNVKMVEESLR